MGQMDKQGFVPCAQCGQVIHVNHAYTMRDHMLCSVRCYSAYIGSKEVVKSPRDEGQTR